MKNGKLLRLTFSYSLIEYLAKLTNAQIQRFTFKLGKEVHVGENSPNNLYAIVSKKSGKVLRISMFKEAAELWRDESRSIYEVWLL